MIYTARDSIVTVNGVTIQEPIVDDEELVFPLDDDQKNAFENRINNRKLPPLSRGMISLRIGGEDCKFISYSDGIITYKRK